MKKMDQTTEVRTWYKWVIAVLSGLIIFIGLGWNSGTRSLYTRTVTVLRDIDRAAYSLSTSIRFGTTAILSLFFGTMIEKMGAKKMVLCGITSLFISSPCPLEQFSLHVLYTFALKPWYLYVGQISLLENP